MSLRDYLDKRPADTLILTKEELDELSDRLKDADSADEMHVRALTYIYDRLGDKYGTYLYKWSRDDD